MCIPDVTRRLGHTTGSSTKMPPEKPLVGKGPGGCSAASTTDLSAQQALLSSLDRRLPSKEKKRKDYTFRRQFNEKPSIIPGCPGLERC
jgi:hypothetical protein